MTNLEKIIINQRKEVKELGAKFKVIRNGKEENNEEVNETVE